MDESRSLWCPHLRLYLRTCLSLCGFQEFVRIIARVNFPKSSAELSSILSRQRISSMLNAQLGSNVHRSYRYRVASIEPQTIRTVIIRCLSSSKVADSTRTTFTMDEIKLESAWHYLGNREFRQRPVSSCGEGCSIRNISLAKVAEWTI